MTGHVIRLTLGGYIDIRPGGVMRHVDEAAQAFVFPSMTAALGVAEMVLELAPDTYDIAPVEERVSA